MGHRTIITIIVIAALFFVFLVPVQAETIPDGCVGCYAHYYRSLSCQFVPVGIAYWASGLNEPALGCSGPIIP
ncbi:MAG: hypothetical protein JRN52_12635 [Nitrososphaerota archaeon]|nr:hypothetical protein [Nitrososphaerota archaeon]